VPEVAFRRSTQSRWLEIRAAANCPAFRCIAAISSAGEGARAHECFEQKRDSRRFQDRTRVHRPRSLISPDGIFTEHVLWDSPGAAATVPLLATKPSPGLGLSTRREVRIVLVDCAAADRRPAHRP